MVNWLEYGYKPFKFRWDPSWYVGAAVEKPSNAEDFCQCLPGVARQHGRLPGSLWADLAEILRGKGARVWL